MRRSEDTIRPARIPFPIVSLRDTDDLVVAIPHLLGFVPRASVVVIAFDRSEIALVARFDLPLPPDMPPIRTPEGSWTPLADAIKRAGGHRVHVAIYPADPIDPDGPGLPHRALALSLRDGLGDTGLSLDAVLCVVGDLDDGRYWAYDCEDPECCPADGRPVDRWTAGRLRATFVGMGRAVLPDRASMVDRLAPAEHSDPQVAVLDAAVGAALDRRLTQVARDGRSRWARETALRLDAALRRCTGAVPVGMLDVDEAAELIVVAQSDLPARDALIAAAVRRDDLSELLDVLIPVVRHGGRSLGGGIAGMVAALAYLEGDGILAMAAVERAVQVEPTQSMSRLVYGAIAGALPPDELRASYLVHPGPQEWDGEPVPIEEIDRRIEQA